jgi:hypothetical protein
MIIKHLYPFELTMFLKQQNHFFVTGIMQLHQDLGIGLFVIVYINDVH